MDWDEFVALLPAPHTVTLEAFAGASAYGDTYAAPVEIDRCFVDSQRKRVKITTGDAAGNEVVSSTQVYMPPGTVAPPGSRITLASGVKSRALAVSYLADAGLGLPEHVMLLLE